MRKGLPLLVCVALSGCDDPTLELSATIGSLSFSADTAVPEELATIDFTVDLEARNESAEVTLSSVTAYALPRDDAAGVSVEGVLMNPQGQGNEIVRLEAGESVTVRVTNGDIQNQAVFDWCDRPAQVEAEFDAGSVVASDTADVTVLCR